MSSKKGTSSSSKSSGSENNKQVKAGTLTIEDAD